MEWLVSLFHQDLIWSNKCKRLLSKHIVGSYFSGDLVAASEDTVAFESHDAPFASSKLVNVLTNAHIGYCYWYVVVVADCRHSATIDVGDKRKLHLRTFGFPAPLL